MQRVTEEEKDRIFELFKTETIDKIAVKTNRSIPTIKRILINKGISKENLINKPTKIYAKISLDDKEQIIDFDEDIYALAKRWNTTMNVIQSSISHNYKGWERIVLENAEKIES